MTGRALRGLLFDKDGTLFDFSATWRGFTRDALALAAPGDAALQARLGAAVGFDVESGAFEAGSIIVAGSSAEVAEAWARLLPGATVAGLEDLANRLAVESASRGPAPATPDLPGLLDVFRAEGRALGVATHDSEAAAKAQLAHVGALDRFGFVAGYDSGHGLKPGPGMVLAFCARAGVVPAEVAMIGDSLHDLGAGRAAGCGLVVGVLTGPATEADLGPHADLVLSSIGDLPGALSAAGR